MQYLVTTLFSLISTVLAASSRSSVLPSASGTGLVPTPTPTLRVTVKNGSYYGTHHSGFNQDFFLGIPFAKPPIGQLRFRNPESLNTTWTGVRPATYYAWECVGYGSDQLGHLQSEDCLYLNVIRPSGYENTSLPVLVWIHGGGPPDARYNLSFIVENSVKIGKPIIGTSIAYRLGPWGFINSDEVVDAGQTNMGLRDQRLALHWIQENIDAFGGDPSKVTIWGQSVGAESVGHHMDAYNGRDDHLFRAAIMESGCAYPLNTSDSYQSMYDSIVELAGCAGTTDTLDCLRTVPFTVINNILNTTEFNEYWGPTLDGDFVARYPSDQLSDGDFVHVPIIAGSTSDEGTAVSPQGMNTLADFVWYLNNTSTMQWALPENLVEDVLGNYSGKGDMLIPSSQTLGGNVTFPEPYGAFFRRSAAYWGDQVFIAGRRWTCETWSKANLTAYCYRFNTIPAGAPWEIGVTHISDVAFIFNNLNGDGYAVNPFQNKSEAYTDLSYLMSNSWISFVHDLNPNNWTGLGRNSTRAGDWPTYDYNDPQNMVWDANVTSYVEADTWRAAGISLINSMASYYHR
ncbi:alpha/beta-hydrolase [Fistulina hepatica ATCC 64428]|uniref:Alpha/beta-hydrolase n=1 Tax=Fistulina hepatica ATCC 64428 TaxID=1128425 RepID=A0A0D7ACD3_9AGAR|nr:alpha/beta-hydrolase [Fistulina hepatica ATCC 64428]